MPELNERLSFWDALNACFCGRWQASPKRGVLYERQGDGGQFERIFVGDLKACEGCGYNLTRTPLENLQAIPAEEWTGIVKGSCLYSETPWQLPEGIKGCTFERCNMDNVRLPEDARGVRIEGGCHLRIKVQNDQGDWVCDWATEAPIEPTDKATRLAEGRNVDPAKLPAEPLTDEQVQAEQDALAKQRELDELKRKLEDEGYTVTDTEVSG